MADPTPITREELYALLAPMKEDVAECLTLLKEQNSRIHKAETDLAVFKDRQPSRPGAMWGASAGAFVGAVIALAEWLLKK